MAVITKAITKNKADITVVILFNRLSKSLLLEKKDPWPPEITPDRPALLPDCSITDRIRTTEITICNTISAVDTFPPPELNGH